MQVFINDIDVTRRVPNLKISGNYNKAFRTCEFPLIIKDGNNKFDIPEFISRVNVFEDGQNVFYGFIVKRSYSAEDTQMSFSCYDPGIYLKRNKWSYNFSKTTPEKIAAEVAAGFGIAVGSIAVTGVTMSKTFIGKDLYSVIMSAYTEASKTTGKKYVMRFTEGKMNIFERSTNITVPEITGYTKLIGAKYSDSIENMVNRVAIYNANDKFVQYVSDTESMEKFGMFTEYLKQTKKDNKITEANEKLEEGSRPKKDLTVDNLGDINCVTGNTIFVDDKYSGLCGIFHIDGDTHEWKNGIYYNKLTLNFEKIMDEQSVEKEE